MTYNLKLSNGSTLVNIGDGVSDTSYSSITLFGKNFAGYGPLLNENQVHMLENFANLTPPPSPLQGQLWWNSQTRQMYVRNLQEWKVIGGPTSSPTSPPVNNIIGDQWWNTDTQQLNIFNGVDWSIVGPLYTKTQGVSGPAVKTVAREVDGEPQTITTFYADGAIVAVLSDNPSFTTTDIPGFYIIRPGFTLTSVGTHRYYGDSDNALSLGGALAANFLRSDVDSTTQHKLSIKSADGLSIGAFDDLTVTVQNNEIAFLDTVAGRDVGFYIKDSVQQSLAMKIDGTTGRVSITQNPVASSDVANKGYVDSAVLGTAATLLRADGQTPIAGNLSPQTNGLYSLGSSNTRFNTIYSVNSNLTNVTSDHGTFNIVTINDAPVLAKSATNKEYVDAKVVTSYNQSVTDLQLAMTNVVGTAPATLSTLGKIAAAINNDPLFFDTVDDALELKAPKANPTFTGTPTVPTAAAGDSSNTIANTIFVNTKVSSAITAALSTTPASVTTSINDAILNLKTYPTFIGQIVAPLGVKITGTGIITDTNNTLDIGTSANRFRNVYASTFTGTAMLANYADLAEMYVADADYEAGTVLEFGGEKEVTIGSHWSYQVAGVVSTNPAYLMNAQCASEFVVALALQGRCPVKVYGPVKKGDILVSAGNGYAESKMRPEVGTVIGKALQNFDGSTGVIEVAVGRC